MLDKIITPKEEKLTESVSISESKSIIEQIPEIIKPLLPEFLKPPKEKPKEMIIITEETPLVMKENWNLLPCELIKKFIPTLPLIETLTKKHQLKKNFVEKVINKIIDWKIVLFIIGIIAVAIILLFYNFYRNKR